MQHLIDRGWHQKNELLLKRYNYTLPIKCSVSIHQKLPKKPTASIFLDISIFFLHKYQWQKLTNNPTKGFLYLHCTLLSVAYSFFIAIIILLIFLMLAQIGALFIKLISIIFTVHTFNTIHTSQGRVD